MIRLENGVELTEIVPEDAEELYTAIDRNRERLHQWLPWTTLDYSPDDVREFIARASEENREGTGLTMVIRLEGKIRGAIGLHRIDRLNLSTSIGYWIDEACAGKGVITAACRAVITEGFERFGLHRVEIRCATRNHRSAAVPRRLNFTEEGILREAEWVHDRWADLRVFSMLKHDWSA